MTQSYLLWMLLNYKYLVMRLLRFLSIPHPEDCVSSSSSILKDEQDGESRLQKVTIFIYHVT